MIYDLHINYIMEHKALNIIYPAMPFIWHYYDIANIYLTKETKVLTKNEFIKITSMNQKLIDILNTLDDRTEYYINIQYKSHDILYNNKNNELYISFHTWLLKQSGITEIPNSKLDMEYKFECGIFPLIGEIKYAKYFPFKKGKTMIPVGIGINSFTIRRARIHELNNSSIENINKLKYNGFSPSDTCNIEVGKVKVKEKLEENIAFVSIIKNAKIIDHTGDTPIMNKCVTLHIFRMIGDNNEGNQEFNNIISLFR
jgi:hypothetical protein